jgi:uncharacterized protein YebE (UPF0316 family)
MVKNLKLMTALFGLLEAVVYIFGLTIVLSGDSTYLEMFVYALGFSAGLIAGIYVEQKLAIGYSSFSVNINHRNDELVKTLRDCGFGVTLYMGEGRDGARIRLDILTKRKREADLLRKIMQVEPKAFIISYEPKTFHGGYISDIMKRRMQLRKKRAKPVETQEDGLIHKTLDEIKNEVEVFKKDWRA